LNSRISIALCLAGFSVFSLLCIASHAPMIEQDIATRCREMLAANHIKADGFSVSGRDVLLTGVEGSPMLNPKTRLLLQRVPGVRVVETELAKPSAASLPDQVKREEPQSPQARAVQEKINAMLQTQAIEFRADSSLLTPQSQGVLNAIVPLLAQSPALRCEIRGYSKEAPDAQRAWMVTLQRALSTEDYLVSKGIADWRLSAQVFHSPENRQIDLIVRER
jgi:outer membrane protein OmpA-like peptidoglycan-associated protein